MTRPSPAGGPAIDTPRRRRLRTYAFDPMSTRLSGRHLTVSIPYEPDLNPGPDGELLQVVDYDPVREKWYAQVDLNDPYVLAQDGVEPREADPRSHQQIVYAVAAGVIERFERYLGRRFRWRGKDKLRLVPHAFEGRNAFFDPKRKAVLFGYYRADVVDPGATLPNQVIFTCLSSDIIAHEVTHAIVHRLRPYFAEASHKDVFAWHEAFADLIALFQHFAYPEVVLNAVASTSGSIQKGGALFDLASEFGQSTGRGEALRRAINPSIPTEKLRTPEQFEEAVEPHERGACFVGAVFDAYLDRYRSTISDLLRIAAGPVGLTEPLHPDLVKRVAREAIVTADRYLAMVVRAFDYLPPVDVTFGDVIRAIVTSDHALYPDDAQGLRRNLIESLRRRGIYPERVISLTDAALAWPAPGQELWLTDGNPGPVPLDSLLLDASSRLDPTIDPKRDPGVPTRDEGLAEDELSGNLYAALTRWAKAHAVKIGFEPGQKIALDSIDVAYRQADDLQPRPEIVVQFTQRRRDLEKIHQADLPERLRTPYRAGTTLIARVDGKVLYSISKPLPLNDPPRTAEERYVHAFGEARFEAMLRWFEEIDEGDALSLWVTEPAAHRLNFASLHFDTEVGV